MKALSYHETMMCAKYSVSPCNNSVISLPESLMSFPTFPSYTSRKLQEGSTSALSHLIATEPPVEGGGGSPYPLSSSPYPYYPVASSEAALYPYTTTGVGAGGGFSPKGSSASQSAGHHHHHHQHRAKARSNAGKPGMMM